VPPPGGRTPGGTTVFRGERAVFLAYGGESDIFLVGEGTGARVLKLYHAGIFPDAEVLDRRRAASACHPERVVRVLEDGFDGGHGRWFELLEHARHGSLAGLMSSGAARWIRFESLVSELCESVAAVQLSDLVHRDVKPANVLVRSLFPFRAALSDFGISTAMRGERAVPAALDCTPAYAPPEGRLVSAAWDWWSLGMTLLEFLTGGNPYEDVRSDAVLALVASKPVFVPEDLPPRRRLLLKGLLTRNMDARWGAAQVRQWLEGGEPEESYEARYADARAPATFGFMERSYGSLRALAAAMASSDEAWTEAERYVADDGGLWPGLGARDDFDEFALAKGALEGDPEWKVFRFVYGCRPDIAPSYRGVPLTGRDALDAASRPPGRGASPECDLAARLRDGSFSKMAGYLLERGYALDPLFLYAADSRCSPRTEAVLRCALDPGRFYWGLMKPPEESAPSPLPAEAEGGRAAGGAPAALAAADRLDGLLMEDKEFRAMGGETIVFPGNLASLLSSPETYLEGIGELRRLHALGALLKTDTPGLLCKGPSAFGGSPEEYEGLVRLRLFRQDPVATDVIRSAASLLSDPEFAPLLPKPDAECLKGLPARLLETREPYLRTDVHACYRITRCLGYRRGFRWFGRLAVSGPGLSLLLAPACFAAIPLMAALAPPGGLPPPAVGILCLTGLFFTYVWLCRLSRRSELASIAESERWRVPESASRRPGILDRISRGIARGASWLWTLANRGR
jgi:hypothetical protein